MGFDAVVGLAVVAFGAGIGFSGAAMNPFTMGVAQRYRRGAVYVRGRIPRCLSYHYAGCRFRYDHAVCTESKEGSDQECSLWNVFGQGSFGG